MLKLYIPKNIKLLSIKNNYIYLFNTNLFIFFDTIKFYITYNKYLNVITLKKKIKLNHIKKKNILNNFFFKWENFFFYKIYFIGKGFKLKKYKKGIIFNFNQSHINFLKTNYIILKKIQKTKLLMFAKNYLDLMKKTKHILKIKHFNVYTNRGLRLTKTNVWKKKNKSTT